MVRVDFIQRAFHHFPFPGRRKNKKESEAKVSESATAKLAVGIDYQKNQVVYRAWAITEYGAKVDSSHFISEEKIDVSTKVCRVEIVKTHDNIASQKTYSVRYFNEKERSAYEVCANEQGKLCYANGGQMKVPLLVKKEAQEGKEKTVIQYVNISFAPGEVIDFSQDNMRKKMLEEGYSESAAELVTQNISILGVMSSEGTIYIAPKIERMIHHSSLLMGQPVSAAFMAGTVIRGQLVQEARFSGHYRPLDGAINMYEQLTDRLLSMGYTPDPESESWKAFSRKVTQFEYAKSELRANGNIDVMFKEVKGSDNTCRKVRIEVLKLGNTTPLIRIDRFERVINVA